MVNFAFHLSLGFPKRDKLKGQIFRQEVLKAMARLRWFGMLGFKFRLKMEEGILFKAVTHAVEFLSCISPVHYYACIHSLN